MKKKITIKDISELAGTSKTTVSFYLSGQYKKMSNETRARIEEAIRMTNYVPSTAARQLSQSHSRLIGVIVGDVTNVFASHLIKGIDQHLQKEGYQMILGSSGYKGESEKALLDQMIKMNVDGFIVQPTKGFKEIFEEFKGFGKPIVYIDSALDEKGIRTVKSNAYEAVLDAIERMVEIGYERFIMFTGEPTILSTRQERVQGFYDALQPFDCKHETCVVPEDVTADYIHEYISTHLRLSEKTLIFVPNCWLLPIVFKGMSSLRNLIPNNIGLLGFDNTEWVNLSYPTVSTIIQPGEEEGLAACKIILDIVEKKHQELPNQLLRCHLEENESTALHA